MISLFALVLLLLFVVLFLCVFLLLLFLFYVICLLFCLCFDLLLAICSGDCLSYRPFVFGDLFVWVCMKMTLS